MSPSSVSLEVQYPSVKNLFFTSVLRFGASTCQGLLSGSICMSLRSYLEIPHPPDTKRRELQNMLMGKSTAISWALRNHVYVSHDSKKSLKYLQETRKRGFEWFQVLHWMLSLKACRSSAGSFGVSHWLHNYKVLRKAHVGNKGASRWINDKAKLYFLSYCNPNFTLHFNSKEFNVRKLHHGIDTRNKTCLLPSG